MGTFVWLMHDQLVIFTFYKYDGIHSNIGLATSADGEIFTKINYGINGKSEILSIGQMRVTFNCPFLQDPAT